jgi:hypothetical protein
MAYLDFSSPPPTDLAYPAVVPPALIGLDRIERAVVMLARHDRPSRLRLTGRLARLAKLVFDYQPPNALSDPRLEALRCFSVAVASDRDSLADWHRTELSGMGFSDHQIGQARRLAEQYVRPRSFDGLIYLGLAAVFAAIFFWIQPYFEDTLASFLFALIVAAPLLALVPPEGGQIRRY